MTEHDTAYAVRLLDAMIGNCAHSLEAERRLNRELEARQDYSRRSWFYENHVRTLVNARKALAGDLPRPKLHWERDGRRIIRELDKERRDAEKFADKALKRN